MIRSNQRIIDVFVSHGRHDTGLAELLNRVLTEQGLSTWLVSSLEPGDQWENAVRNAMAECHAVVILLTPVMLKSQWLAVEVGAAIAWDKPIYVLYDGVTLEQIPAFLSQFQLLPVSQMSEVVSQILKSRQPLSEQDRASLLRAYQETGLSADQIMLQPRAVSDLSSRYRKLARTAIPGERLVKELLRMRKQGKLPRRARVARS